MRDIDIITKAMEDAQVVLHVFVAPGARDAQAVVQRMLEIFDQEHVVAAQDRLRKGYGQLRLVK